MPAVEMSSLDHSRLSWSKFSEMRCLAWTARTDSHQIGEIKATYFNMDTDIYVYSLRPYIRVVIVFVLVKLS
jgi:hypothetical protein